METWLDGVFGPYSDKSMQNLAKIMKNGQKWALDGSKLKYCPMNQVSTNGFG